ncbi:CDP-6-deoxy-delta-3,4-glucoseen reductase [Thauera sp.]|jgi:CDP-4-dehydro-6-deoxyglucose reductase|uniref:CDP-6-deoxy-delta-3,4-glucoseen reductase n=1 Tax=Thauera sp. TaxID=1905334 RepID=UPI00262B8B50|nr:CDP-6-deoxy-delta-3,4-glucoseen reductase [Thauera sp.]MCK6408635.1 CDP-6-deoxy-delta-3,4-glucoseen reductase [Thauera sp.]
MTHRISLQPGDHPFEADDDQTVLEAALGAGLLLPHGCRDGACGACKGRVLEGRVDYGRYVAGALTAAERAEGLALFCCAKPLTDLVVQARTVSRADEIPVKKLPCRVQKLERLADDVMVVDLKLPASENFAFRAGQYVDILLADGQRRSFSIANAPHDGGHLELHVRRIDGGRFTGHVFATMKEKEILRFEGPLGSFWLREDSTRPIVMIAGGTGFAPIKGLVEHAIHAGLTRPVTLYWGARTRSGLYMDALARTWETALPGLRYVPVLSDEAWEGRCGLVHQAVLDDFADLSGFDVYACGAPAMIDAARANFCAERGLPAEAFFADAFTFASPAN